MTEPNLLEGIRTEDWAATPESVKRSVQRLIEEVNKLRSRVEELEEQLRQNSSNSSRPPSSDPPNAPKYKKREGSGKKQGGRPGHKGAGRSLKPVEEADDVIKSRPVGCEKCGALLLGEDPTPARHQVTELPKVKPILIEYQRHSLKCLACGAINEADWPQDMPRGSFGPRLEATVGYLSGRFGNSQRDTEEVMETLFNTDVSLGSISTIEERVSEAIARPVEEAKGYVKQQPVNNVDETGWKEKNRRAWLWVSVTSLVIVFLIRASRGSKAVKELLGDNYSGIVGSDRGSAYNSIEAKRRQVCWSHLGRDFQAIASRGGESALIGQALVEATKKIFELWHRVRDRTLSRIDFQYEIMPIAIQVRELLQAGANSSNEKTRRTCKKILKVEDGLWVFVWVEGVEPTNNSAEQALRRGVMWRKRSYGTQSEAGSRYVERILTAIATLRQQKRDVLDYLTEACRAAIAGLRPPSLLPLPKLSS